MTFYETAKQYVTSHDLMNNSVHEVLDWRLITLVNQNVNNYET
jgi:hypothetical protein